MEKQMNMLEEQVDLMEDVERFQRATYERDLARIQEKLRTEYENTREKFGRFVDRLPDGLVLITSGAKYRQNRTETHYYRVVVGHHNTVSGPMTHIISAPNEEWPDVPPWAWDEWHKCQWIYPSNGLWVKKEPEYQPEVKWHE